MKLKDTKSYPTGLGSVRRLDGDTPDMTLARRTREVGLKSAATYTVAETASIMGVSRPYLYALIKEGKVRVLKTPGGVTKIPRAWLMDTLKEPYNPRKDATKDGSKR